MLLSISRFLILSMLGSLPAPADNVSPDALAEGGHWKRLRTISEQRLASNPNDAQAAYFLAAAKEIFGDLQGALPLAERAVALEPRNARYHYQVGSICISLAQSAGIFKGLGMARRFKKEMETAIELDPKSLDARQALMEFYWQAPTIAGGDKKKARGIAEEIGQIDAAQGYLAQVTLAQLEKNTSGVENFYRKALAASPHDYRVLSAVASYYTAESQKKFDLTETYGRETMKIAPERSAPYVLLAIAYTSQERWKDLDALLEQAVKSIPDDLSPFFQAGKILLRNGKDNARAEQYFRKYLTQDPEGGQPNLAAAHWRLGQVLEKEGKKPEAIAELETSIRLQPNFEPAKKDLKRLR